MWIPRTQLIQEGSGRVPRCQRTEVRATAPSGSGRRQRQRHSRAWPSPAGCSNSSDDCAKRFTTAYKTHAKGLAATGLSLQSPQSRALAEATTPFDPACLVTSSGTAVAVWRRKRRWKACRAEGQSSCCSRRRQACACVQRHCTRCSRLYFRMKTALQAQPGQPDRHQSAQPCSPRVCR